VFAAARSVAAGPTLLARPEFSSYTCLLARCRRYSEGPALRGAYSAGPGIVVYTWLPAAWAGGCRSEGWPSSSEGPAFFIRARMSQSRRFVEGKLLPQSACDYLDDAGQGQTPAPKKKGRGKGK